MAPDHHVTTTEMCRILGNLGTLLRETRLRRGLTLQEAAQQIGCAKATIHRTEHGGGGCSLTNAISILRWLDEASGYGWTASQAVNAVQAELQRFRLAVAIARDNQLTPQEFIAALDVQTPESIARAIDYGELQSRPSGEATDA